MDWGVRDEFGRGEQPGHGVVSEEGTGPSPPRLLSGCGRPVVVPAADVGHGVEQVADEMHVHPPPPPDRGDHRQGTGDFCGGVHRLGAQSVERQLVQPLHFGGCVERKQRGLERTHAHPPHEANGCGCQVSSTAINVRAEHGDEMVGWPLRGEQVGGGELGMIRHRVGTAHFELHPHTGAGGRMGQQHVRPRVVPEECGRFVREQRHLRGRRPPWRKGGGELSLEIRGQASHSGNSTRR